MISSAAASNAAGATSTKALAATAMSRLSFTPISAVGSMPIETTNATRLSASEASAKKAVAPSLPAMICQRGTGVISSGSSDLRSRSPAVVSMAMCIEPTNTAIRMKYGRNASTWPPLDVGVDRSSIWLSIGRVRSG